VIPVYRTTRHVKRQMNDMQERFNQQQTYQQRSNAHAPQTEQKKSKPNSDDYIEFEEVR
jgi:Sec-independent protein translocase protein TatA